MKTASLLVLVLALPVPAALSQATSASAAATSQSQTSLSRDQAGAATNAAAAADASATKGKLAGSAQESSAAASQLGKTSAATTQTTNLSAELTQKISSKDARVGDQVVARTTSTTQLAEGTKLPKGTRLVGQVTSVQAKSGAQHDGHLAFTFTRATLRDGREIPIHATLQSISAPAVGAMASGSDDFAAGPAMAGGGGAVQAGGGGGRGLLGGSGGGGVALPQAGGIVSGASSTVGSASGRVTSSTEGTLRQGTGLVSQTGASAAATVHNLPGVTGSGSATGDAALDAHGRNVDLSGGTQLVFAVSAN